MIRLSTIDGRPHFASPEEHAQLTQTTPASFVTLPPILRCQIENVKLVLRGLDDQLNWSDLPCTLFISEREVGFYSDDRNQSLIVPYQIISLHAVSRVEGRSPSIYCQLDECITEEIETELNEDEASELEIVPNDAATLDTIFQALSHCASLHPSVTTDGTNGGFDFDPEDLEGDADSEGELTSVGRANLDRLDSLLNSNEDQSQTSITLNGNSNDHHESDLQSSES